MDAIGRLANAFWILAVGAIALYGFFVLMGAISPTDLILLTAQMGILAILAAVHFIRVRRALSDHRHDELARSAHAMRERRGF